MKSIAIFGVSNGVGITKDIELIQRILLNAGYDVETHATFKTTTTKVFDLGIFLERFAPKLFPQCKKLAMIPNQEWFEPGWLPAFKEFDVVYTKTHFATEIFKNLGKATEYISFTSEDRYMPEVPKDEYHWIHVAGKSIQKQTETVIRCWEQNSGFPQLTIIQDPKFFRPRSQSRNINFMSDRVPEYLLKVMQNCNAVHVCPSETEGFGHYIMEAMSCKSLVLTTNATPMTELVTDERGFFVQPVKEERMRLSIAHKISDKTLEEAVIQILITEDLTRRQMGEKGRAFYLENDALFKVNLVNAVGNTLS